METWRQVCVRWRRADCYLSLAGGLHRTSKSTNPVTGAAITADVNGNNAARQEPDPLGR